MPANILLLHFFNYPDYNCKTQFLVNIKDQYKSKYSTSTQKSKIFPASSFSQPISKKTKTKSYQIFLIALVTSRITRRTFTIQNYKRASSLGQKEKGIYAFVSLAKLGPHQSRYISTTSSQFTRQVQNEPVQLSKPTASKCRERFFMRTSSTQHLPFKNSVSV